MEPRARLPRHRVRFAGAVAAAWSGVASGAFGYLASQPATDDYSGWIAVMFALQIPAFWAIASVDPESRCVLDPGRRAAFAIPAGLVAGFCAVLMLALVVLSLGGTFESVAAVAVALLALAIWLPIRTLQDRAHPDGPRLVAIAVALVAAALPLAFVLERDVLQSMPEMLLMLLTPLAWTVPLWPFLRRPRSIPEARVRR